jgi:hypothetical protein
VHYFLLHSYLTYWPNAPEADPKFEKLTVCVKNIKPISRPLIQKYWHNDNTPTLASLTMTKPNQSIGPLSSMTFYEQALCSAVDSERGHKHQTHQVGESDVSVFCGSQSAD